MPNRYKNEPIIIDVDINLVLLESNKSGVFLKTLC